MGEEVVWIEVLSRLRDVVARHRCAGPEIRVGRAYDNDVVLDDPYIAPHHLRIRRSEAGGWIAEDLGSAGGLFLDHARDKFGWVEIDGDRVMRIGHTYLRLRAAGYAVAPERTDPPSSRLWPVLGALAAVLVAIDLGSRWLAQTTEPKLSPYLVSVLTVAVLLGTWAAVWSVLTRIFSGQARFERNLLIALAGMLIYSLYGEFVEYSGFALSWSALATYQSIGAWSLLAAVCFLHLREVSPSRLRLKAGLVIALLAAGIGVHLLSQSELRTGTGIDREVTALHLLPPEFRLAPLQTEDTFFTDVEALKTKLDHDRTEPIPAPTPSSGPLAITR
ncbi:MAG TPA: FHA domain-containing protein [Stellaceae bacterium]|nr:FHA domain-containing protein [Stellaceae bacterium]